MLFVSRGSQCIVDARALAIASQEEQIVLWRTRLEPMQYGSIRQSKVARLHQLHPSALHPSCYDQVCWIDWQPTILPLLGSKAARLFFFFLHCRTSARHGRSTTGICVRLKSNFPGRKKPTTEPPKTSKTHTQAKARARQICQGNLQTK